MFKWILAVLLLQTYTATFSDSASTHYPLTFSNYVNPSESQLVDDTKPNWIHADPSTAFKCQGTIIHKDYPLQVPRGNFLITYIYHRPSIRDETPAKVISEVIKSSTGRAVLTFDYSLEPNAELRVYVQVQGYEPELKWDSGKRPSKLQTVSIPLNQLQPSFRVIIAAKVQAVFPYGPRTYLSQALFANGLLTFI